MSESLVPIDVLRFWINNAIRSSDKTLASIGTNILLRNILEFQLEQIKRQDRIIELLEQNGDKSER